MGLFTVTFAGLDSGTIPIMVEASDRNDALVKAIREIPQIARNDPIPIWYCHDGDMEERYRRDPRTRKSFADWLQQYGYVHDDRRTGSGGYFRLISIERDISLWALSVPKMERKPTARSFENKAKKSEQDWIRGIDELPTDDAVKILRDRYLMFHHQPYEIHLANDKDVFNWIVRYRDYDELVSKGDAISLNEIRFQGFLNILAYPESVLDILNQDAMEGSVEAMYLRDELVRLSKRYESSLPKTSKKDIPRLPKRKYKRVKAKSKAKTVKQIPKKKTGRK